MSIRTQGDKDIFFREKMKAKKKNHVYNQKRGKNTNNPTHSLNPSS